MKERRQLAPAAPFRQERPEQGSYSDALPAIMCEAVGDAVPISFAGLTQEGAASIGHSYTGYRSIQFGRVGQLKRLLTRARAGVEQFFDKTLAFERNPPEPWSFKNLRMR